MLLKLGSNISEVSGSISGDTFQKSQGGIQARKKPCHKKQPSSAQTFIRSIHKTLLFAWQNLSEEKRVLWNTFARVHPVPGKFGSRITLSGQTLFIKYQFPFLFNHLPLILSPYEYTKQPLGPNLIVNGIFNGQAPWVILTGFTYSPGKMSYLDLATGSFREQIAPLTGSSYQLQFTISDCPGFLSIAFLSYSGAVLFNAPYHSYNNFANGTYYLTVVPAAAINPIRIFARTAGNVGSISDISLKLINS